MWQGWQPQLEREDDMPDQETDCHQGQQDVESAPGAGYVAIEKFALHGLPHFLKFAGLFL